MERTQALLLVRYSRKVAWALVPLTAAVILTGYFQSILPSNRPTIRTVHLVLEWIFIALLSYHALANTALTRFRWRSGLKRLLRGRASAGLALRFALRISSWALLVTGIVVTLSGLSWYGIVTFSFNQHLRADIPFVAAYTAHAAAGSVLRARKMARRKERPSISLRLPRR